MKFNFQLIEYIIYLEFILVGVMVLTACLLKIFFSIRQTRRKKIFEDTERYLRRVLKNKSLHLSFPKNAKKMNILLPIIKKFDETLDNKHWEKIKEKIGKEILHKLARKNVSHWGWSTRFLAAESFKVYADDRDQELIVKLIEDKYPLVTISAGATAVRLGVAKAINALIDRMSTERRLALTMFLMLFEKANSSIYDIIVNRLAKEKNSFIRGSCYKILQKLPHTRKFEDFHKDLQSNNLELKLSVMRYIAYSQNKNAIATIIKMLHDDKWEVRSTAVQLLGDLDAVEAINKIAPLLRDSEWWVRINAALALEKLGSEGIKVLKSQDPEKDKYAYEAAQHVLESAHAGKTKK